MHRPVSIAVVAVIITASVSTPAVSETSERTFPNLDVNTQPQGEEKRLLRVQDEASDVPNEERVGPPIEVSPSEVARIERTEPHAAIPNLPNEQDMALIRDHAVARFFDTTIDIRMVGTSLAQLRELQINAEVDNYKLIIMAIGNELLKPPFPDGDRKHYGSVGGFSVMKKYMGAELYKAWTNLLTKSCFSLNAMFEMMRYLIAKTDGLMLDLSAYGYMAMGRVLLSNPRRTPSFIPILPSLEQLSIERCVDPVKAKLWLQLLKEQNQNSGKDEYELILEAIKRAMGDHLTLGQEA